MHLFRADCEGFVGSKKPTSRLAVCGILYANDRCEREIKFKIQGKHNYKTMDLR